jgi:hypothetical protein
MSHINRERSRTVHFFNNSVCSACCFGPLVGTSEVRVRAQFMLYVALFPTVIYLTFICTLIFCMLVDELCLCLSIFRSIKQEKPTMFIFSDVELDCIA